MIGTSIMVYPYDGSPGDEGSEVYDTLDDPVSVLNVLRSHRWEPVMGRDDHHINVGVNKAHIPDTVEKLKKLLTPIGE